MSQKRIDRDKIINAFIAIAFEKSAGAVSLSDIAERLDIKKASLYNHFSSRDEMYDATISFCVSYFENVMFMPDSFLTNTQELKADTKTKKQSATNSSPAARMNTIDDIFTKLISQYFRSHTMEPLLQIYSFIHSEKYFNETASVAAQKTKQKIASDVKKILEQLAKSEHEVTHDRKSRYPSQNAKRAALLIENKIAATENADTAEIIAALIVQSLDEYILERKNLIRKNPEESAGGLFELPFDENIQEKLSALVAKLLSKKTSQASENSGK